MQLYYSQTSPFVRKVLICAMQTNQFERIQWLDCAAHPVTRDRLMVPANPLAQVPTLVTGEGLSLYDSPVICEYLCTTANDQTVLPPPGPARWPVLVQQALADGLMTAAVLLRAEVAVRPDDRKWQPWHDGQVSKIEDCADQFERWAGDFGERIDLGTIAIACALGYVDFRHPGIAWRQAHPQLREWYEWFSQLPCMTETAPPAA